MVWNCSCLCRPVVHKQESLYINHTEHSSSGPGLHSSCRGTPGGDWHWNLPGTVGSWNWARQALPLLAGGYFLLLLTSVSSCPVMAIWLKHRGGRLLLSFKLMTSLHPVLEMTKYLSFLPKIKNKNSPLDVMEHLLLSSWLHKRASCKK